MALSICGIAFRGIIYASAAFSCSASSKAGPRSGTTGPGCPIFRQYTATSTILQRVRYAPDLTRELDLHSFQSNKQAFFLDQRSTVPLAQLINTIDTPYENENSCGCEEYSEDFELDREGSFIDFCIRGFVISPSKFQREGNKYTECKDLEGEACERYIYCPLIGTGGSGGGSTADSLEDKRCYIARDEDPVVEFCRESSVFFT